MGQNDCTSVLHEVQVVWFECQKCKIVACYSTEPLRDQRESEHYAKCFSSEPEREQDFYGVTA